MRLSVLPLLAGCQFLSEQRDPPDVVSWTGYVYADTPADGTPYLTGGGFEVVDLDGIPVATGSEPFDDSPGYWQVDVPVGQEVAIRLSGPGATTTVFRTRTPTGRAYWFGGSLFTRSSDTTTALFDSLRGWDGLDPADLADGEVAHLWGEPLDREAFAGAGIEVIDGEGESHPVVALAADEEGLLVDAGDGPVDVFVAVDLAPGDVTLSVESDAGSATTTWPALGGDLLSPVFLALVDGA